MTAVLKPSLRELRGQEPDADCWGTEHLVTEMSLQLGAVGSLGTRRQRVFFFHISSKHIKLKKSLQQKEKSSGVTEPLGSPNRSLVEL